MQSRRFFCSKGAPGKDGFIALAWILNGTKPF